MTKSLLHQLQDSLDTTVKEQYLAVGVKEEQFEALGFVNFGENEFLGYRFEMMGLPMEQYYCCDSLGNMFYITFTAIDAEVMEMILNTFTVSE